MGFLIAGIVFLVLVVAILGYLIRILVQVVRGNDKIIENLRHQLEGADGRVSRIKQVVEGLEGEVADAREQHLELKSRYGLIRKDILKTLDELGGMGFKAKNKGPIERSKPWQRLKDIAEKLKEGV